jgi:hypothetical protein
MPLSEDGGSRFKIEKPAIHGGNLALGQVSLRMKHHETFIVQLSADCVDIIHGRLVLTELESHKAKKDGD